MPMGEFKCSCPEEDETYACWFCWKVFSGDKVTEFPDPDLEDASMFACEWCAKEKGIEFKPVVNSNS